MEKLREKTVRHSILLGLLLLSTAAHAQDSDDSKLKSIIGVDMQQLTSCTTDTDCVSFYDFRTCCRYIAVNIKFQSLLEQKQTELRRAMMSDDSNRRCSVIECDRPNTVAVCKSSHCEEVSASVK